MAAKTRKRKRSPWWALWPSWRQYKGWSLPSRHAAIGLSVAFVSLGLVVWGLLRPGPRTRLTQAERERMIATLSRAPQPHEKIQLGCPDRDVDACLAASQFLNVFTGAGWDVMGDRVRSVALGKPAPGITILRRAAHRGCRVTDVDPEDDWAPAPGSEGGCFRMTPSVRAIQEALASVGFRSRTRADVGNDLPEDAIGVFVGPRLFEQETWE